MKIRTRHRVVANCRSFWCERPVNSSADKLQTTGRYWDRGGDLWVELTWPTWFGLSNKKSFLHEDCFTFESYIEMDCGAGR